MQEEINLLEIWNKLFSRRKFIFIFVSALTIISIIYSLVATHIYRAEASIMPIGGNNMGLPGLLSDSPLGNFFGEFGTADPAAPLMAALDSRTIAEQIINRFSLMPVFFESDWDKAQMKWKEANPKKRPNIEDALKELEDIRSVEKDLDTGLITITADFKSPELAAEVVNGYIEELNKFLNTNELTTAKKNRVFIEQQLQQNKAELLETGKELANFYNSNNISNLDPRLDVDISLEAPKLNTENPTHKSLASLTKKTEELKIQLKKFQTVKEVPQQVYLEYLNGYYQLLGQINVLLAQQYEMAKISEAKEDISFQIIDSARVPLKRYKPKRTLIVAISFISSLVLAIFIALFMEHIASLRAKQTL